MASAVCFGTSPWHQEFESFPPRVPTFKNMYLRVNVKRVFEYDVTPGPLCVPVDLSSHAHCRRGGSASGVLRLQPAIETVNTVRTHLILVVHPVQTVQWPTSEWTFCCFCCSDFRGRPQFRRTTGARSLWPRARKAGPSEHGWFLCQFRVAIMIKASWHENCPLPEGHCTRLHTALGR